MIIRLCRFWKSDAPEIDAKRFKSQEVFVTGDYEFPCDRPRPSSIAEGHFVQEDDDQIEKVIQETNRTWDCKMGRWQCQTASITPPQWNLRGTNRWQRSLQGDCWCSSETGKNTALALPCIEKNDSREKPQAGATWIYASEEQSLSEVKKRSAKWSDNIWNTSSKKDMWEAFTMAWYTSQFLLKKLWCRVSLSVILIWRALTAVWAQTCGLKQKISLSSSSTFVARVSTTVFLLVFGCLGTGQSTTILFICKVLRREIHSWWRGPTWDETMARQWKRIWWGFRCGITFETGSSSEFLSTNSGVHISILEARLWQATSVFQKSRKGGWLLRKHQVESRTATDVVTNDALMQDDGIDLIVEELHRKWGHARPRQSVEDREGPFRDRGDVKTEATFMSYVTRRKLDTMGRETCRKQWRLWWRHESVGAIGSPWDATLNNRTKRQDCAAEVPTMPGFRDLDTTRCWSATLEQGTWCIARGRRNDDCSRRGICHSRCLPHHRRRSGGDSGRKWSAADIVAGLISVPTPWVSGCPKGSQCRAESTRLPRSPRRRRQHRAGFALEALEHPIAETVCKVSQTRTLDSRVSRGNRGQRQDDRYDRRAGKPEDNSKGFVTAPKRPDPRSREIRTRGRRCIQRRQATVSQALCMTINVIRSFCASIKTLLVYHQMSSVSDNIREI